LIICKYYGVTLAKTLMMDAKINDYLSSQPEERLSILIEIHTLILENDKTVVFEVEPMMGKEMIVYKHKGMMKYALAGVKKYISLHVLPMYMNNLLYDKYKLLLDKASFKKGCINFEAKEQMPLTIVQALLTDCSKIDLYKMRETQLQERKLKAKSKK